MSSAVHVDLNHDKEIFMMLNFSDSKLIVLVMVVDTSRTSSCFTVLLLRGKSGTCCSTVFLMSVNFSCPDLYSSATRFTASSPGIPCSPYTVDYNIISRWARCWMRVVVSSRRSIYVNQTILSLYRRMVRYIFICFCWVGSWLRIWPRPLLLYRRIKFLIL